MTTYRRFCCNDLLRFGPLNLQMHSTNGMDFYLTHLSLWPANCHVADTPGGRITGYILGSVEGMDVQRVGQLSVLSLPYKDLRHLVEELPNLLEDSCDKIYKVYTMKMLVHAERTEIIREFEKLGYRIYREHGEYLEYRKPLPLLVALAREDG